MNSTTKGWKRWGEFVQWNSDDKAMKKMRDMTEEKILVKALRAVLDLKDAVTRVGSGVMVTKR